MEGHATAFQDEQHDEERAGDGGPVALAEDRGAQNPDAPPERDLAAVVRVPGPRPQPCGEQANRSSSSCIKELNATRR